MCRVLSFVEMTGGATAETGLKMNAVYVISMASSILELLNSNNRMAHGGSVYIMTNVLRTVVYIGVTSELRIRILQHREHYFKGSFTDKYNCTICVYYENFSHIQEAIAREKELKKWNRTKKNELITLFNAQWIDLWPEIEKW